MKRFCSCIAALFLLTACSAPTLTPISSTPTIVQPTQTSMPPTSTPEPTSTPAASVTLRRGINFGNMLEAPNEGEWGLYVQEEYFDLVKGAGFDFVRLPVNWKAHTTRTGYDDGDMGYTIEPAFFALERFGGHVGMGRSGMELPGELQISRWRGLPECLQRTIDRPDTTSGCSKWAGFIPANKEPTVSKPGESCGAKIGMIYPAKAPARNQCWSAPAAKILCEYLTLCSSYYGIKEVSS